MGNFNTSLHWKLGVTCWLLGGLLVGVIQLPSFTSEALAKPHGCSSFSCLLYRARPCSIMRAYWKLIHEVTCSGACKMLCFILNKFQLCNMRPNLKLGRPLGNLFVISTSYLSAELLNIQYAQSGQFGGTFVKQSPLADHHCQNKTMTLNVTQAWLYTCIDFPVKATADSVKSDNLNVACQALDDGLHAVLFHNGMS